MMRAIRSVSTERGRDPRVYALFAFGGNGPVFAAAMAQALSMKQVIIPPSPGLFSSFGLLYADVEHHYSRTFRRLLREMDLDALNEIWDGMVSDALAQLAAEGFTGSRARIRRSVNMHYQGQTYELTVPAPEGRLDKQAIPALEEAFGKEHELTYGHRAGPDEPVELVNIQVVGLGVDDRPRVPEELHTGGYGDRDRPSPRQAYFGPEVAWLEAPILHRADLQTPHEGPCIVEEYDATTVIPPKAKAALDAYGNIVIDLP
jgi:N-methylhydantoinase A